MTLEQQLKQADEETRIKEEQRERDKNAQLAREELERQQSWNNFCAKLDEQKRQLQTIIDEAGLLQMLARAAKYRKGEIEETIKPHGPSYYKSSFEPYTSIIEDWLSKEQTRSFELRWNIRRLEMGSDFGEAMLYALNIKKGEIKSCHRVTINVNVEGTISITGRDLFQLTHEEWRNNTDLLEEHLTSAILKPEYYSPTYEHFATSNGN